MPGSGAAGSLWVKLGLSSKQFDTSLKKAENNLKKFGERLNTLGMRITQSISLPLAAAGGAAIKMAADMETAQVALTTLMGSASAATKQMAQLKQFAASTPFRFTELLGATRRMMAFGFQAKETIPILRNLGNASFALGQGAEGVNNMILALGQMRMKGRAQSEELTRQLGQYVGAWQYLADYLTKGDIQKAMNMVEKRMIDGETAVKAVLLGIANDPKFKDGMAKQIKTLAGQWSNFRDQLDYTLADIGGLLVQTFDLKGVINNIRSAMEAFSDWFAKLDPGMRKLIVYGGAAAAVFGPLLILLGKMALGWSALIPVIGRTILLIKAVGTVTKALVTGQAAAATAATGLAAALGPFLIGAAVIAGLVGIVALIKKFRNASKDAIKNYEKLAAAKESKKNVDNLAQAYEKLTDKINNAKPNSKEWKELKKQERALANQIAHDYPKVFGYYDKMGDARDIDIEKLKEQLRLEKELNEKRLKNARKQAEEGAKDILNKAKSQLAFYRKQLNDLQSKGEAQYVKETAGKLMIAGSRTGSSLTSKQAETKALENYNEGISKLAQNIKKARRKVKKARAQLDEVMGKPKIQTELEERVETRPERPKIGEEEDNKIKKLSSVLSQWEKVASESKAALLKNLDDIAMAERRAVNASAEKAQKDLERNYKELKNTKNYVAVSAKIEEDRKNKITKINQDLAEQKKQIQSRTNAELLKAQIIQATNENAILNQQQRYIAGGVKPEGMLKQGNLDLLNRPVIKNADKTISTVRSMTVAFNDFAVLLPTVREGLDRIMTDQEAIDWFMKTGEHLGKFSSEVAANKYAEALHKQQEELYTGDEKFDYLKNNYGKKFALELLEMQNTFEQNLEKYQKQGATKTDISNYTEAYKLQLAQKYKEYEQFIAKTNALRMELEAQSLEEQGKYTEAAIKQEEAKWERAKATLSKGTTAYKLEYQKYLDSIATIQKDADEKLREAQIESQKSKIDDQIQGLEYQIKEAELLDDEVESQKLVADLQKKINDLKIKRIDIDIAELRRQKDVEKDATKRLEIENKITDALRERIGLKKDNAIIDLQSKPILKTFAENWQKGLSDSKAQINQWGNDVQNIASTIVTGMADAFDKGFFDVLTGKFSELSDIVTNYLNSILRAMTSMFANSMVTKIMSGSFGAWLGGLGGGSAATINPTNIPMAGKFAKGGYIPPGMWGITGEKGPEPIYGGNAGVTVLPNKTLNGEGVTIKEINVINQTGIQAQATTQTRIDPDGYVINVILDGIATNKGGLRDVLAMR
jgi:tape measure domain-containing protein